jgi:hypothetical protein
VFYHLDFSLPVKKRRLSKLVKVISLGALRRSNEVKSSRVKADAGLGNLELLKILLLN